MINFGITDRKKQELEQRMHNCNLLENDIEETFVRSSGAGPEDNLRSYLSEITSYLTGQADRKSIKVPPVSI